MFTAIAKNERVKILCVTGGPGVFDGTIPYTLAQQGPGRIEILDLNPADGAVLGIASLQVILSPGQAPDQTPQVQPTVPGAAPTPLPPPPPHAPPRRPR